MKSPLRIYPVIEPKTEQSCWNCRRSSFAGKTLHCKELNKTPKPDDAETCQLYWDNRKHKPGGSQDRGWDRKPE